MWSFFSGLIDGSSSKRRKVTEEEESVQRDDEFSFHSSSSSDDDDEQVVVPPPVNTKRTRDGKAVNGTTTTAVVRRSEIIGDGVPEVSFTQNDMKHSSWPSDDVLRSALQGNEVAMQEVKMLARCMRDMFLPEMSPLSSKMYVVSCDTMRSVCLSFGFSTHSGFSILQTISALSKLGKPFDLSRVIDVVMHAGVNNNSLKMFCTYHVGGVNTPPASAIFPTLGKAIDLATATAKT